MVEVPWGGASDPVGVASEPLEEFLTPSRVISPNLQERCRHLWWKVLIGSYSRQSERHPPQIELLTGSPSENLCPFRGGQL